MLEDGHDLFSVVEIEVGSRCNRRCTYCPVALDPHPSVPVRMPSDVFSELTRQLSALSFAGRVSYHFYNEPLLRRDLGSLVAQMAVAVPDALQVLYTNGDRLDDARYHELHNAGIDYFVVTLHDNGAFPERPFQLVQTSDELVLTNRGGLLVELPAARPADVGKPCFAPSEMLIVTVTGDVVLCYEDARRTHVMGNIMEQPVDAIWRAPRFAALRRALAAGRRSMLSMCRACSNVAHVEPGASLIDEPFAVDRRGMQIDVSDLKAQARRARRERGYAAPCGPKANRLENPPR